MSLLGIREMGITDRSKLRRQARKRRHRRVRKKVVGSPERPRLAVFRSLKHIYAQLIDDSTGRSLLGVSSLSPEIRGRVKELGSKCAVSRAVGLLLAQKARERGVTKVVFDRGGYLYHGRVKALAEGAREGGLEF